MMKAILIYVHFTIFLSVRGQMWQNDFIKVEKLPDATLGAQVGRVIVCKLISGFF